MVLAPVAGVKLQILRTQERGISRKTIAQGKAGMLRLYLYARARLYTHLLHTRPRVQQAPGVPCALSWAKRYSTARAFAPRQCGRIPSLLFEMRTRLSRRHCEERIHLTCQREFAGLMRSLPIQSPTRPVCVQCCNPRTHRKAEVSCVVLSSGPVQFVKLYWLPHHRCTVFLHLLQVKRPISMLGFRFCVA